MHRPCGVPAACFQTPARMPKAADKVTSSFATMCSCSVCGICDASVKTYVGMQRRVARRKGVSINQCVAYRNWYAVLSVLLQVVVTKEALVALGIDSNCRDGLLEVLDAPRIASPGAQLDDSSGMLYV